MTDIDLNELRLHLVGCGKMGSALLKSWLAAGVKPEHVTARVASTASAELLHDVYGIRASTTARYDGEDAVVLGVKPQMLDGVLAENWNPAPGEPLYVSIAAGKTLDYFSATLGEQARIVRLMPNTPAMVRQGVSTLVGTANITEADRAIATALGEASGTGLWLESEEKLVAATAVAGSGPAYVFHFAECLMQSAEKLGLPRETATVLVRETIKGSAALADQDGWENVAELRRNVTSKGGVTQAALEVLMAELPDTVQRMLEANVARSKELE